MRSWKHPSVVTDENFRILDESTNYILGHMWEDAILVVKATFEDIDLFNFYGDPMCGIILDDKGNCLIGGDILIVWKDNKIITIEEDKCKWIHCIRRKDDMTVEILTDPWSNESAIWELDIVSMKLQKVDDFTKYREEPFQEVIQW